MVILHHSKVQLAVWQLTEHLNAWYRARMVAIVVFGRRKTNSGPKAGYFLHYNTNKTKRHCLFLFIYYYYFFFYILLHCFVVGHGRNYVIKDCLFVNSNFTQPEL